MWVALEWGGENTPSLFAWERERGGIQRVYDSSSPLLGDFLPPGPASWLWDKERLSLQPTPWIGKANSVGLAQQGPLGMLRMG